MTGLSRSFIAAAGGAIAAFGIAAATPATACKSYSNNGVGSDGLPTMEIDGVAVHYWDRANLNPTEAARSGTNPQTGDYFEQQLISCDVVQKDKNGAVYFYHVTGPRHIMDNKPFKINAGRQTPRR